jgi:hypothetical protein
VDNATGGLVGPNPNFDGGAGAGNTLTVTGTAGADNMLLTTTFVNVNFAQFTAFTNVQQVTIIGGAAPAGTGDSGYLFDTAPGNHILNASPTQADLPTGAVTLTAKTFPQVRSFATGGGQDTANLSDSPGVDLFVGTPTYNYFTGTTTGFLNLTSGFATTTATATTAGDFALLFDSAGVDTFTASPTAASLTNGSSYTLNANGFSNVRASSQGGGDIANLTDTTGAPATFRSTESVNFLGSNTGSYLNLAIGFTTYNATGNSSSGNDTADLYDAPGNNTFAQGVPDADSGRLTTANYTVNVSHFGTVRITETAGGFDQLIPGSTNFGFSKVGNWK